MRYEGRRKKEDEKKENGTEGEGEEGKRGGKGRETETIMAAKTTAFSGPAQWFQAICTYG